MTTDHQIRNQWKASSPLPSQQSLSTNSLQTLGTTNKHLGLLNKLTLPSTQECNSKCLHSCNHQANLLHKSYSSKVSTSSHKMRRTLRTKIKTVSNHYSSSNLITKLMTVGLLSNIKNQLQNLCLHSCNNLLHKSCSNKVSTNSHRLRRTSQIKATSSQCSSSSNPKTTKF